jgi:uncharacterized membrane protein
MKVKLILGLWIGILFPALTGLSAFKGNDTETGEEPSAKIMAVNQLKEEAFRILDTKCNGCHRKQNPFMIFSEKNMSKRAKKIYRMVFIERRMPKGNEVQLTQSEYNVLNRWLKTENTF